MPVVSIIANFYKSEPFIPQLIDSVINQTFQDWELICVNDCSPWGDLQVLQKYAIKDKRIRIVNNEINLGISKAKFEGIKYATGKYLMFIDGDDWLEPEALQRCVTPAENEDIDMVIMSSQKVLKKGLFTYRHKDVNQNVNFAITQPELFDTYFVNFFGVNIFPVTYWGKLIRRDAFDRADLSASDVDYAEDQVFTMNLFPHLRSMYLLDYIGYNWRWGGITSGRVKINVSKVIQLLTFVLSFFERRMQILNEYNYKKGKKWLTIELVNYLLGNISQVAATDDCPKDLEVFIADYLHIINANQQYLLDCTAPKYAVVRKNDPVQFYMFCRGIYKQNYWKNKFKSWVHYLVFNLC